MKLLAILLLSALCSPLFAAESARLATALSVFPAATKPNINVVLTDDQDFTDFGKAIDDSLGRVIAA